MDCNNFFDVGKSDKYRLKDFTFQDINVSDKKQAFDPSLIENTTVKNVNISANGIEWQQLNHKE